MTIEQIMTILSFVAMMAGFFFQANLIENKIIKRFYLIETKLKEQNIRLSYLSSHVTDLDRYLEKTQDYHPRQSPELKFEADQSDLF